MKTSTILIIVLVLLALAIAIRGLSKGDRKHRRYRDAPQLRQKYHQGSYTPRFPHKYRGDVDDITFRSDWERIAFKWCDLNLQVVAWASEEVRIPYRMKGIWYERAYYPDLLINFKDGATVMVEIKPSDQKFNPDYENRCKWAAARSHCRERAWSFLIWDETTIEKLRQNLKRWHHTRHWPNRGNL